MALFCVCQVIAEGARGGWARVAAAALLAAACGAVFYARELGDRRRLRSGGVLHRPRRVLHLPRHADRVRLRAVRAGLPAMDLAGAAQHRRRPVRVRAVASDPALDPDVHRARAVVRRDRHGAHLDRVPGDAGRASARRPVLCAARRDVSGFRHLGGQGGRHGGGGAGAGAGDAAARRAGWGAGLAARRLERDERRPSRRAWC